MGSVEQRPEAGGELGQQKSGAERSRQRFGTANAKPRFRSSLEYWLLMTVFYNIAPLGSLQLAKLCALPLSDLRLQCPNS